ncbi:hypothetical protein AKJ39_02495 [candidate division MSBL1 archaeon SCGC-AAA259J03]|uniref:N-acetyltransferase domain-containing protein n=2 Tax=candidate division MSBL1 TaxID=215777 RepID=A0A656YWV4_9EURY|nr:hypothetical protein AKJ61_01860 [candidate division MSBL1 archaeon SCGC-AAA259B11]KXA98108.1 hypothetical protein AKJ39_02495 [candidate division MSBL1 archaeon SCGC-AAA259J03]
MENRNFPAPNSKLWFSSLIHRSSGDFLVATDGRSVLGYLVGILEKNFKIRKLGFKKQGHLLDIAVKEEERRRGVGTSLLKTLVDRFKEKDVNSIRLEVRTQNRGARKFYRSLGWGKKELVEGYYPNGDDALVMRKMIG